MRAARLRSPVGGRGGSARDFGVARGMALSPAGPRWARRRSIRLGARQLTERMPISQTGPPPAPSLLQRCRPPPHRLRRRTVAARRGRCRSRSRSHRRCRRRSRAAARAARCRISATSRRSTLSPAQERKLGEAIMRQIRAQGGYLDDPEVNDYLNELGNRLVAAVPGHQARTSSSSRCPMQRSTPSRCPAATSASTPASSCSRRTSPSSPRVLAHEITHVTQHHLAAHDGRASRTRC